MRNARLKLVKRLARPCAAMQFPVGFWTQAAAGGGTPGNFTVDLWQTFETALPTGTNLNGTDNNASAAWQVNGIWTTSINAENAIFSTFNSTGDTGVLGLVCDNNTGSGNLFCDLNSYPTTQSVGIWIKVTACATDTYVWLYDVGELGTAGAIASVKFQNISGTTSLVLIGTGNSSTITASVNTWYWLTCLFVKNGTCKMRLYSTAGVQVGSEVTCTGNNENFYYHEILGVTSSSTGVRYWDDLVIDKTTAVFPLGP